MTTQMRNWLAFSIAAVFLTAQTAAADAPASKTSGEANADGVQGLTDANADRLGLFPTAHSLRAGQFVLNDYELFLVQMGYGVTDRLQLAAATVLPNWEGIPFILNLSAKYRYYDSTRVKLAVLGTITLISQHSGLGNLGTVGNALSYCLDDRCDNMLNATVIANIQTFSEGTVFLWMGGAGGSFKVARRLRLLAEVATAGLFAVASGSGKSGSATVPGGLLTYGLRLFGEDLAADLLFVKPFSTTGAFKDFPLPLGIPVVNVSYKFGG